MPNFNSVQIMGNLCRDPELRATSGNQSVANLSIAVNRKWKTQDGQDKEEVTFVDCEVWSKTAEAMAKYLHKGDPVFVYGRLKTDQWTDKEGKKQSKLKVMIEGFQFVNGPAKSQDDEPKSRTIPVTNARSNAGGYSSNPPIDDVSIPF